LPVDINPRVGNLYTFSLSAPTVAHIPIWGAVIFDLFLRTHSPTLISKPIGLISCPISILILEIWTPPHPTVEPVIWIFES
jgi:hypothetical protein